MRVILKHNWFAPGSASGKGFEKRSGRRYAKGVHEMPEEMRAFLPSTALVVGENGVPEPARVVAVVSNDPKDYDDARVESDREAALVAQAEAAEAERVKLASDAEAEANKVKFQAEVEAENIVEAAKAEAAKIVEQAKAEIAAAEAQAKVDAKKGGKK